MDFDAFFDEYQLKSDTARKYSFIVRNRVKYAVQDGYNFSMPQTVSYLLFGDETKTCSATKFYETRRVVRDLYCAMVSAGELDEEIINYISSLKFVDAQTNTLISTCYFKDLQDVLDFVDLVGRLQREPTGDGSLFVKSIAILAWHGFSVPEMASLKKTDLRSVNKTVLIKRSSKREAIKLNNYFDTLWKLRCSNEYYGPHSNRPIKYRDSDYLFRGRLTPGLSANVIVSFLKRYNAEAYNLAGKKISINALAQNSLFLRVLEQERKDCGMEPPINVIKRVLQCDDRQSFVVSTMYRAWKENLLVGDGEQLC